MRRARTKLDKMKTVFLIFVVVILLLVALSVIAPLPHVFSPRKDFNFKTFSFSVPVQKILVTPLPSAIPSPISKYKLPDGCQSSDQSFCSFTENIKTLLRENSFVELADLYVAKSYKCGGEYEWTPCQGKKDGIEVFAYNILGIGSEGGIFTKEELATHIKTFYLQTDVDLFQGSISKQDTGQVIFLDREQKNALDFHSKKVSGEWKIDYLEDGVYSGPGSFSNSETLFDKI